MTLTSALLNALLLLILFSCSTNKKESQTEEFVFEVIPTKEVVDGKTRFLAEIKIKNWDNLKRRNYSDVKFFVDNRQIPQSNDFTGHLEFTAPNCNNSYPIKDGIQTKSMDGSIKFILANSEDSVVYFPIEYKVRCK